MNFGGVNWTAIVIAAVAGFIIGGVWYRIFGKKWMEAAGVSEMAGGVMPYVWAAIANLMIAIGLAGIVGHLGPGNTNLRTSIISAIALWFAFIIPALFVNYTFARRKPVLIAIDGGQWLAAMVAMGVVIGAMGVK